MIHLLSKSVSKERNRQCNLLPPFYVEKRPISLLSYEDVLDCHFCIVDFFNREGYGMGGIGIKEVGTFISTVERQYTGFGNSDLYDNDYEKIASLMYGIIKNHPFYDGNKRTAFLSALLQLYRMGRLITVPEKEFEDLMVQIADDSILKKAGLKDLKKKNVPNAEIKFLGRYLEKNSRKKARLTKTIKFRQLRQIVEANGFTFAHPNKGTIDLIKVSEQRIERFWKKDKIDRKETVIATIAYHGEGVDVVDSTLKHVRRACGLTDQDGFDGEVLLRDAQPTFQLINSYRTALQSLAYR